MGPKVSQTATNVVRRQSLRANVIRACKKCGAPGYWHNTPGVNVGCYAPEKVTQLGMDPVGSTCPNCGAQREPIEGHGEIWAREWRVGLRAVLRNFVRGIFNPLRWRTR